MLKYELACADRKELANRLGELKDIRPRYTFVPRCAYIIGEYAVEKNGDLIVSEEAVEEDIIRQLMEEGLIRSAEQPAVEAQPGEATESSDEEEQETSEEQEDEPVSEVEEQQTEPEDEQDSFSISIPKSKMTADALERLGKILESKGKLIQKALGASSLKVVTDDEKVTFPWFNRIPEPEEVEVYTKFIAALCKMARQQKRVSAKEKPNENEKYAFRCFLLRLDFIGDEYKRERKLLLKNFDGSSAYRTKESAEKAKEKLEAQKAESQGNADGEV